MRALAWLFAAAALSPVAAMADPVTDWNASAGRAAIQACISPADDPLHESRMYAMMHVAIHDALNAIDRRSRPYAYDARAAASASTTAAVAAAAHDVLVTLIGQIPFPFPAACLQAGIASVEADYTAALAAVPAGPAKTAGIAVGQAAAAAILALRAADGSSTPLLDFAYPQGTAPGEYRFTTGVTFAFAPGWGQVTPFVLNHASQFAPAPPYHVNTRPYAEDLNEVKAFGGNNMTTPSARTPEQTQIALFWLESSPLAWNRIGRAVSASRGLDLWENARLFGLLNLSMADGYIASWEAKYRLNFWRPETAIREADNDGNPNTAGDPSWTPLQPTYAIPDHDSAHSVEGGAASEAFKQFFGTDEIAFSNCSLSLPPGSRCGEAGQILRSFKSFSQAADENGLSRILVGIHFRHAVEEGIKHGQKVAQRAANLFLRPTN
jgi:hypothetical protein